MGSRPADNPNKFTPPRLRILRLLGLRVVRGGTIRVIRVGNAHSRYPKVV